MHNNNGFAQLFQRIEAPFPLQGYDWANRVKLGSGSFAKVYRVRSAKQGFDVAIKQIDMANFKDQQMINALNREVAAMAQLKNDHILRLYEYQFGQIFTYLVLELCDGDLRKLMKESGGKLKEETCVEVYCQIAQGFKEMIGRGYVHRDIKPENILYKGNKFKISDFGFAKRINTKGNMNMPMVSICGTPMYMAPQLLNYQPYHEKSDIWSLGIMLYELLYGYAPWPIRSWDGYKNAINVKPLSFPYDIAIGVNTKDFITKCLVIDQQRRIGWNELFNHPLISHRKLGEKTEQPKVDERIVKILKRLQEQATRMNVNVTQMLMDTHTASMDLININPISVINITEKFDQLCHFLDKKIQPAEVRLLFEFFDKNHNHEVSFDEFIRLFVEHDFLEGNDIAARFVRQVIEAVKMQKIDLQEFFNRFDINHDKQLEYGEFVTLIKNLMPKIRQDEIQVIFHKFDRNGSNSIAIDEFMNEVIKGANASRPDARPVSSTPHSPASQNLQSLHRTVRHLNLNLGEILLYFDRNKDGGLDFNEFGKFVKDLNSSIPKEQVGEMFGMLDLDKDGRIGGSELARWLTH